MMISLGPIIFGLICSAISVIMTAIEIYFFSLFIV